jgi:hypothetical protein
VAVYHAVGVGLAIHQLADAIAAFAVIRAIGVGLASVADAIIIARVDWCLDPCPTLSSSAPCRVIEVLIYSSGLLA